MIKQRRSRPPATPVPAAASVPTTKPGADTPNTDTQRTGSRMGKGKSKGVELGEQIGRRLKSMFKDVVAEPVPEKFRQLLEELGRKSDKS
jgi:Anti-sigma factor NepR